MRLIEWFGLQLIKLISSYWVQKLMLFFYLSMFDQKKKQKIFIHERGHYLLLIVVKLITSTKSDVVLSSLIWLRNYYR